MATVKKIKCTILYPWESFCCWKPPSHGICKDWEIAHRRKGILEFPYETHEQDGYLLITVEDE